jgi:toxin ParE1/3/4
MFSLLFTPNALADLEQIYDYIAADNLTRAQSFRAELIALANDLQEFPELGSKVKGRPRLRQRVHGSYVMHYQIRSDTIEIVSFQHGSKIR